MVLVMAVCGGIGYLAGLLFSLPRDVGFWGGVPVGSLPAAALVIWLVRRHL